MSKTAEEKAAAKAAKEAEKEAAKAAKEAEKAAAKAAKEASGDSVVVKFRDHRGEPTSRTFSRADHGDDFAELAEEFKATNASKIIE